MWRYSLALGIGLLSLLFLEDIANAASCASVLTSQPVSIGASFSLVGQNLGNSGVNLAGAIGYWNGCAGYGTSFPSLDANGSSTRKIIVKYIAGESTNNRGSCGRWTPTFDGPTGQVKGGKIEIWEKERGNNVTCNGTDTLAHELGHLFGLGDATNSNCNGTIMGSRVGNNNRTVAKEHCGVARSRWLTLVELNPFILPFPDGPCVI